MPQLHLGPVLIAINYRIHTDAIKENLIPKQLVPAQISYVYASEADILFFCRMIL